MTVKKRSAAMILSVLLIGLILLSFVLPANAAGSAKSISLPIIRYRNLSAQASDNQENTITADLFESDLRWLLDNGYATISISQLLDFVYNSASLPDKPVMISFDGAFESFYTLAFPLLEKYNMNAVVNVLGRPVEDHASALEDSQSLKPMTWTQIETLAGTGRVEFENQTYSLDGRTGERKGCGMIPGEDVEYYQAFLRNDLEKLQKLLSIYAGSTPLAFAYTCDKACPEALPVLKQLGFKAAFTFEEKLNTITIGDRELLFSLGRFVRVEGLSSNSFFEKIQEKTGRLNLAARTFHYALFSMYNSSAFC